MESRSVKELKDRKERIRVSDAMIAEKAGVQPSTICRLLNGTTQNPGRPLMRAVEQALTELENELRESLDRKPA